MWRQKASDLVALAAGVFPDDVETIRNDLEQAGKQLQSYYYQIVLRELQTLSGHPDRLHRWTRAAIEMAESTPGDEPRAAIEVAESTPGDEPRAAIEVAAKYG